MRATTAVLTILTLSTLTTSAVAMTTPMSPEELEAGAELIVQGEVTEVICDGTPVVEDTATITAYIATLTVESVSKGDDTETVTLPFTVTDWEEGGMPPSCAWSPQYFLGDKGTYYLIAQGTDGDHTLLSWSAFVPDDDSVSEDHPNCTVTASDAASGDEEVQSGEEDASIGPNVDAGGTDTGGTDTGGTDPATDPTATDTGGTDPATDTGGTDPAGDNAGGGSNGGSSDGSSGGCSSGAQGTHGGLLVLALLLGLCLVVRRRVARIGE